MISGIEIKKTLEHKLEIQMVIYILQNYPLESESEKKKLFMSKKITHNFMPSD